MVVSRYGPWFGLSRNQLENHGLRMVRFQIRNVWFGLTRNKLKRFGFGSVWFDTLETRFGLALVESETVWFSLR